MSEHITSQAKPGYLDIANGDASTAENQIPQAANELDLEPSRVMEVAKTLVLEALQRRCQTTESDDVDDAKIIALVQLHLERQHPESSCATRSSSRRDDDGAHAA